MEVLSHPLTYAMAGIVGFFLKDLFNKVQKTTDLRAEIDSIKARVILLEVNLKEQHDTNKAVIRLEEQVKRLSQDIQYLLTLVRVTHDKTDTP